MEDKNHNEKDGKVDDQISVSGIFIGSERSDLRDETETKLLASNDDKRRTRGSLSTHVRSKAFTCLH